MEAIIEFLDWLESREGLLSAITALAAMVGICYGVIAFFFPSVARRLKRAFGHEPEAPAGTPSATDRQAAGEAALPARQAKHSGLAVLPLRTLSAAEEDRNIAAGISSEISADLAQLSELRVASHLATMQFQGDAINLKDVADTLSVRYVLTGSFQRSGERMRLMAELTDALSGEQLWASTYDHELKDLFEVQGEVSRAIVAAIGGELKLANTRIAYDAPTDNLDAWGLVQKAFNFWLTHFTPDDYDHSLSLLRKAVKLDPGYAAARASLAMILSQRVINNVSQDPEGDREECLAMMDEAVRLGPRDITVLENAGLVWTHHGQAPRAIEALRQATELAPLNLIAWGYLSFPLGWTGTPEEAEEAVSIIDRLLAMAPKHPSRPYWLYFRSTAQARLDNLDEAEGNARKTLELQPSWFLAWVALANIHGRRGDAAAARHAMDQCQQIHPLITGSFVVDQVRTICMSDAAAEPLLSGLFAAGLVDGELTLSDTEALTT